MHNRLHTSGESESVPYQVFSYPTKNKWFLPGHLTSSCACRRFLQLWTAWSHDESPVACESQSVNETIVIVVVYAQAWRLRLAYPMEMLRLVSCIHVQRETLPLVSHIYISKTSHARSSLQSVRYTQTDTYSSDMSGGTSEASRDGEGEGVTGPLCLHASHTIDEPDTANSELDDANPDAIVPRVDRHLMPILALSVAMVSWGKGSFHVCVTRRHFNNNRF